jgi:toxin ParE1/3/4
MAKYRLSRQAKEDLIRIHNYGVLRFGASQADKNFDAIFEQFETIAERPYSFEAVDDIQQGYRRCVCGVDSIFFRVHNQVVEIMTIVGRQDIHQLFK